MDIPAENLTSRLKTNGLSLFLAALAFGPLLWNFFILSWSRPAYQFFPMALIAAGMLAWREIERMGASLVPGNLRVTRLLAVVAGLVCLFANLRWSPWLGFIGFLAGMVAVIWGLGGRALLKALAPALFVLLAILPPPMGLDEKLTLWLRTVAVHISCSLLDWLSITLVQDGNTIQLPGKTLFVEEACSGINSFILCNVFCLFWFLWQRRPLWWLLVSLPATSLFVVLGNVLRITLCSAAYNRWQLDLLEGWRHETLGLVLLMGYCVSVMSLDQLLVFLLYPAGKLVPGDSLPGAGGKPATPVPPPPQTGFRSGPVLGFKFAGAILVLLVAGILGIQVMRHGLHRFAPLPTILTTKELKLSMPPSLAGWTRVDTDTGNMDLVETLGVHSINWHYHRDGMDAEVAADYPFGDFHDVRLCYLANGWRVAGEELLVQPQTGEDLHAIKLILEKSLTHALVLHSVMNKRGDWLSRPKPGEGHNTVQSCYRVQIITGGYAPVTAAAATDVQTLFFQARALLAQQMVEQLRKPGQ